MFVSCLNSKKKEVYDITSLKYYILNYMGCIVFDNEDLTYKDSNYIAYNIFGLYNRKITNIYEILSEKNHNIIKNASEYEKILYGIEFIINDIKLDLDIRIIKYKQLFIILIYNYILNNFIKYTNNVSFNDCVYNIDNKIINNNFINSLSKECLEYILLSFNIIILKHDKLKVLYIDNNTKKKLLLYNIKSIYDYISHNNEEYYRLLINDIINNNKISNKIHEPIDLQLNNIFFKYIFKIYKEQNKKYIFFMISYDGLDNKKHIDKIVNELYSKKTLKYIEYSLLPPADTYDNITILFLDIVDFSNICEKTSNRRLNKWMIDFHDIINKYISLYQITKIEVRGDCYICLAGLETNYFVNHYSDDSNKNKMTRIVNFSIKIIEELNKVNTHLRIGIHTGKATISYINDYDFTLVKTVYGNDVNIAARMEQSGKTDLIHMTKTAAEIYANENNLNLDILKTNYITYKNIQFMETYLYDTYLKDFVSIDNDNYYHNNIDISKS